MAPGGILEVINESEVHDGAHYAAEHRHGLSRQLLAYRDSEPLSHFMNRDDEPGR
jgi:hypothetical protein